MGRSFWAQKGYLALALDPLALVLARPISGTRTNEKLPYGSSWTLEESLRGSQGLLGPQEEPWRLYKGGALEAIYETFRFV